MGRVLTAHRAPCRLSRRLGVPGVSGTSTAGLASRVMLCLFAQLRLLLNPDFRAARSLVMLPSHSCCCSPFTEEGTEAPRLAGWS